MADSCDDDDGDGDSDGAATDAFGGKYDPGYKYNYDNDDSQPRQSTWPATCNALKFTCHKFPHKAAASTSTSTAVAAAFVDSHLCV